MGEVRLDQRWQWYSRDGNWNYQPVTPRRRVAAGTVDAAADKSALVRDRVSMGPLSPGRRARRMARA